MLPVMSGKAMESGRLLFTGFRRWRDTERLWGAGGAAELGISTLGWSMRAPRVARL
jgi:hypothetical protein